MTEEPVSGATGLELAMERAAVGRRLPGRGGVLGAPRMSYYMKMEGGCRQLGRETGGKGRPDGVRGIGDWEERPACRAGAAVAEQLRCRLSTVAAVRLGSGTKRGAPAGVWRRDK